MIVFVNRFAVRSTLEEFERAFAETASYFVGRRGFLRSRLVRSIDEPGSYVNIAEWEEVDDLQAAVWDPAFENHAKKLRALASSESQIYEPVST